MRPLKLTMYGFQSYGNKTEIDFELLGSEGTYLIAGSTGSGKSSIFDAIKYALYGYSSGSERKNINCINTVIRDKIKDGDPTAPTKANRPFVSLYFEADGNRYTITRKPQVENIFGLKGSWNADVELVSDDRNTSLSSVSEINAKIEELTGLDESRFSAVAMIAQGEFTSLVCAKAKDREEILSKIFDIHKFSNLDYLLKKRYDELSEDKKALETTLKSNISNIKSNANNDFNESLETAKSKAAELNFDLVINALDDFIDFDKTTQAKIKLDIQSSEKEKENVKTAIKEFDDYNALDSDISLLNDKLGKAKSNHTKLLELKASYDDEKGYYDNLAVEQINIESQLKKYEKLSAITNGLNDIEEKKIELNLQLSSIQKAIERTELNLKTSESFISINKNLEADIVIAEEKLKKIVEFEKDYLLYCAEKKALLTLERKLKTLERECDFTKLQYSEISARYFSNISASLAAKLGIDEPCPVCGSINHPKLAEACGKLVSEDELKESEEKYQKANNTFNKSKQSTGERRATVVLLENNLKNIFLSLYPDTDFESLDAKTIHSDVQDANNKCTQLNSLLNKRQKYEKDIQLYAKRIEEYTANELKIKNELTILETKEEEGLKNLSALRDELKFKTENEALDEIFKISTLIKDYNDKVQKVEKEIELIVSSISTIQGTLGAKMDQLSKLKKPEGDLENLRDDLKIIDNNLLSLKNDEKNIHSRIDHNIFLRDNISQQLKTYENVSYDYNISETLYKVVHGTMKGANKISFNKYILSIYFKEIVYKANIRFEQITDGRFRLESQENGGLGLNVRDLYNNTLRDAATLSGGEKFKAALSLAFAFQDEMGGSGKLECLFIDEGFGSLSDNDLTMVLNLLVTQAGAHKQIGVISHVAEMREKINKYIFVSKDLSGNSSVEVSI